MRISESMMGQTAICAILSPSSIVCFLPEMLIRTTPRSPRYCSSIVPMPFATTNPFLSVSPLRERIWISYPSPTVTRSPVLMRTRSIVSRVIDVISPTAVPFSASTGSPLRKRSPNLNAHTSTHESVEF